jgi:AraC-like DNA-binding protein
VSESHFARSFKAAFGETPHRYLLRRRMERAKALLRAGELSVTEVCLEVGFTSLGSFSTQFRRFVGESPTAYRDREGHAALARVPGCLVKRYTRPASSDRETARDERTLDTSRRSSKPRDRAREVATGGSRSG